MINVSIILVTHFTHELQIFNFSKYLTMKCMPIWNLTFYTTFLE